MASLPFSLNLYRDWLALKALSNPSKHVVLDGKSLDIGSVVAVAKYGILPVFYFTKLKLCLPIDMAPSLL